MSPSSELCIGLDVGGSTIRASMSEWGSPPEMLVVTGGANPYRGEEEARGALSACLEALRTRAGSRAIRAIAVGMAGASHPLAKAIVRAAVAQSLPAPTPLVYLLSDVAIAHQAAFGDGFGLLVAAGTGSIACGGRPPLLVRRGGLGPTVGDEGSGSLIGRRGLRAAARAIEGRGEETLLARAATEWLGEAEPIRFEGRLKALGGPAPFARAVASAAAEKDAVAQRILAAAGEDLAALAIALRGALSDSPEALDCPLAVSGSVLKDPFVFAAFSRVIAATGRAFSAPRTAPEAALGALAIAASGSRPDALIDGDQGAFPGPNH